VFGCVFCHKWIGCIAPDGIHSLWLHVWNGTKHSVSKLYMFHGFINSDLGQCLCLKLQQLSQRCLFSSPAHPSAATRRPWANCGNWWNSHSVQETRTPARTSGTSAVDFLWGGSPHRPQGRPVPAQWVFCGVDLHTGVELIPRRDASTLLPIIQHHILPGTRIWSDECGRTMASTAWGTFIRQY